MATLVLTTVGSLVGGPVGGAIGAAIGSQIDQRLIAPGRKGPRLGDLSVQTSSYGSAIPKLFGTMRVAGTVIWATDLREDTHKSSAGKGGGKTTTYSYSASFAVALSGRPIREVGRIWADGKLLRGAAGDWKSETGFRLYLGGEKQPIDPLIASAEGIDATPAHRGIAYAVFDTLQLADFGNRIPSLTFEVMADAGPVAIADIAATLSDGVLAGGVLAGDGGATLLGYAASGDSVRGAIESLAGAYPLPLVDDGAVLRIGSDLSTTIDPSELGASADADRQPRLVRDRGAAAGLPDSVELAYYEPARDYQAGLQRARRDGIGLRGARIDMPAAISADEAKGLAEAALGRAWAGREQATLHLPWRRLEARAGGRVSIDGGDWRVRGWKLEHMALALELGRDHAAPPASGAAAGRASGGLDALPGTTILHLLDLPAIGDAGAATPQLWIAGAGSAAGWRRAELSLTLDGGASWQSLGRTALPATIGSAATMLAAGPHELFDRRATVDIDLLHAGMALRGADEAGLAQGANLALLGDEILQFGMAEQIGARRWRLGRLLRGRRGSDWAIASHAAGERFVLLEAATLLAVDLPLAALGTTILASASGLGDAVPANASTTFVGRALRPPAPIGLTATRLADGTIRFGWTRRSRQGWAWLDGADAPLGEADERYRLEIAPAAGTARTVETTTPGFDYGPAAQASDGAAAASGITATVTQLGTIAPSLPASSGTWTL